MKSQTVSFLRGLAIICVVLVHTPMFFNGIDQTLKSVLSFGQLGCQVFFVMSAYCLCLSYTDKEIKPLRFAGKRFMSLAPAFWSTMLIGLAIHFLSVSLLGSDMMKMDTKITHLALNAALLHGVLPLYQPMNQVVNGGWFVGTLMVLYCLYPVLAKLYFKEWTQNWKKYRKIAFPAIMAVSCWALMIVSGSDQESFCLLGSAKYFHFLNQLPCFVLGFSLYDIEKEEKDVRGCRWKVVGMLLLTAVMFYTRMKASYLAAPFAAGMTTVYFFHHADRRGLAQDNKLVRFISHLGDNSYAIYLSHFWIVFCIVHVMLNVLHVAPGGLAPTSVYFIYLPFMLVLVYYCSELYSRWISYLRRQLK